MAARAAGMAPNTVRAADSDVGLLIAWLAERGVTDSEAVEPEHLRAWFTTQAGLSGLTLRRRQWAVEAFLRWACGHFRAGLAASVPRHPCLRPTRRDVPRDRAVDRIINAARERGKKGIKVAAVVVLARMGLTTDEIVALDLSDVSPLRALVTVRRPGGPEPIIVPERHRPALKAAMDRARGPAVPNKLGDRTTARSVRRLMARGAAWAKAAIKLKDVRRACMARGGPERMSA